MGRLNDLARMKFGRLTVLKRSGTSKQGSSVWLCLCSCGKEKHVAACNLLCGRTKSCGCLRKELVYERGCLPKRVERKMLYRARMRAKRDSVPFSITLEDIVIPKRCPVFGTRIVATDASRENSPSLDRKKNSLGYVRGNVFVVSYRANRIKNDATPKELRAILSYMERSDGRP